MKGAMTLTTFRTMLTLVFDTLKAGITSPIEEPLGAP